MKLIRHSTFETNSSSCHTISVAKDCGVYEGVTPDYDGTLYIEPMEFGWGYDKFTGAAAKLSYIWIYIIDWSDDKKDRFMEMFRKVVLEHTGATEISVGPSSEDEYYPYGYIDHQSVEDSDLDYLFEDEQTLKDFLFSKDSFIITDNDNY